MKEDNEILHNDNITTSIATLILAGGKSSRMGQDKALVPIRGRPMLRRVYDVAAQCCPPVYLVSPWCDRYRSILPSDCTFISEMIVSTDSGPPLNQPRNTDGRPTGHSQGPLVGFYQGFLHICSISDVRWVLLLACDLPNLQANVLSDWITHLPCSPASTIAALPPHPTKGWQPLCGFYHRSCLPLLQHYFRQGGRSFQGWLALESVRSLPLPNSNMLFNCNTPSDLAQLD